MLYVTEELGKQKVSSVDTGTNAVLFEGHHMGGRGGRG